MLTLPLASVDTCKRDAATHKQRQQQQRCTRGLLSRTPGCYWSISSSDAARGCGATCCCCALDATAAAPHVASACSRVSAAPRPPHRDDLHACHDGAGWVGAVRADGDDADVAVALAPAGRGARGAGHSTGQGGVRTVRLRVLRAFACAPARGVACASARMRQRRHWRVRGGAAEHASRPHTAEMPRPKCQDDGMVASKSASDPASRQVHQTRHARTCSGGMRGWP